MDRYEIEEAKMKVIEWINEKATNIKEGIDLLFNLNSDFETPIHIQVTYESLSDKQKGDVAIKVLNMLMLKMIAEGVNK